MIQGSVSGTEFAPSHFETRRFSFYEIPFLHIQITPIKRTLITDGVSRQLRTKSLVSVPRGRKPTTWHLVSLSRGPAGTPADAALLADALTVSGPNGLFWRQWNSDFPNRAAVLWPIVQRLAQRELYVLIPELMQLARSGTDADDGSAMSQEIDRWLINQYAGLIKDLRDAQQAELANEMLQEARRDYPQSERLADLEAD